MIEIAYTPAWFHGKDIVIDLISTFVLSLVAAFSVKYYSLDRKNKNYLYLSLSFFMLAVAFLFKILTNFTLYYHEIETKHYGLFSMTYHTIESDSLFFIGFLLYRILTLIGLYALYSIYQKNNSKFNFIFVAVLLIITAYLSQFSYYVFHVVSLILLGYIIYNYYGISKNSKNITSKLLFTSFAIISLTQIGFIFIFLYPPIYVMSEIVQLLGYIGLLITFILVLKLGKKKKQA